MRSHRRPIAAAAGALALGGLWAFTAMGAPAGAASAGAAPVGRPALWRTYDMIVNLHDLPRTYTCDELWYAFHGILLHLGAWTYSLSILPYHCSPTPTGDMKSPDVEVRFQLPFFLQGEAVKWAPTTAIERTVRLVPGEPQTLHPADCQLLQQISQTLFASLPLRIDGQHFACSAPPPRSAHFEVTLSLPMAVKMPSAPTTSASGPG